MALQIRKAERRKAKLRLALIGPTNSGKTMSALRLAYGIGGKVGMIDTEHGSGDLYADTGEYDVISLEPPFTVPKYREAIQMFENAGHAIIIVDSLTHAWAGEGGLLDKQGQLEKDTARFKNSFQTWREITPEHNKLVEELLGSPAHIIATLRVKTEYVIEENERGKKVPRKIGLAPVFRDGIEYEFTMCMDIDQDHYARASKDRTMLFNGWRDQITEETGRQIKAWLDTGAETPPPQTPDDALLERIEKALLDAKTPEKIAQITNHQEAQQLGDRLPPDKKKRMDRAIFDAIERVAPPKEVVATDDLAWPEEAA